MVDLIGGPYLGQSVVCITACVALKGLQVVLGGKFLHIVCSVYLLVDGLMVNGFS